MEHDELKHSFYLRAIRTGIGSALREHYAVDEPLTQRLAELLKELDEAETETRPEDNSEGQASRSERSPKRCDRSE
jgi:hypothetical protein